MTVTALITLHRYVKEIPSVVENASALLDIATACLFLASKTEEHTVKVRSCEARSDVQMATEAVE